MYYPDNLRVIKIFKNSIVNMIHFKKVVIFAEKR